MRSLIVTLSLALASTAAAQQVSVTGRIEPADVPPACPGATHRIQDTNVHLFSTTLDLSTVSTVTQVFTGTDVGAGCPLIDVSYVTPSGYKLSVCRPPALGCTVNLDQCPSPTDGAFVIAASLSSSYLPLGPVATVLVDPFAFVPVATGTQTAVCQSSPLLLKAPALSVGLSIYLQAANVSSSGQLQLTNLTKMTIEPATILCSFVFCH
jgi:hypothetical protein